MKKISKLTYCFCTALLMCCLTSNSVLSQDENTYTEKEMNKYIKQKNLEVINPDYINYIESSIYKDDKNLKKSIDISSYFIDANKKYYGDVHPKTAYAYVNRANMYSHNMIFDKAFEDLKTANDIYQRNLNNYDLGSYILSGYVDLYFSSQDPEKALEYLNKISNSKLYHLCPGYLNMQYANAYSQTKDISKAVAYYSKIYKEIEKNNGIESKEMFYYHLSMASLYQMIGDYSKCEEKLAEAEKLLTKLNDEDERLLINLNKAKIMYLNEILEFDIEQPILAQTADLIAKHGGYFDEEHINQYYIDYYREKKEFDKLPKYFKIIDGFYKNVPSNALTTVFFVEEKQIDTYRDSKNYEKAKEHSNIALNTIEPVKEYAPSIYIKFLLKSFDLNKDTQMFAEAKKDVDEAYKYCQKAFPSNSYMYFDVYKKYGEFYEAQGNPKEALKYFDKALKINLAHFGCKNKEIADVYVNIAKNTEDAKSAFANMDKAIEILEYCYGENHAKVYEKMKDKYHLYHKFGMNEEADKLLEKINEAINSNSIKGCSKFILNYDIDIQNAYIAMSKNDFDTALKYSDKALSEAENIEKQQHVYRLKYEIYSVAGNKIKAAKYKKFANIQ